MAFLVAENENRQLEDLLQADFGRYILSVRTNSKTENFLHWKTMPIVCLGSDSTHVFILSAPKYFTIFIRGLSILLFSLMN